MIRFTIPAVPVAQPRQRHRVLTAAGRTFAQNYTPEKSPVNAYKASCRAAARDVYQGPPLVGPIALTLTFVMPRPGSMIWKKRPMPRAHHGKRPDCENLVKSTQDALSGLVYRDDCQIAKLFAEKVIAAGDEQPCVIVELSELTEGGNA
jgi:Holliday junction resolvase RusA-like endonuclease